MFQTTHEYLRGNGVELMKETSRRFVPLAAPGDDSPRALKTLLRPPLEAQELTITGLVRQLDRDNYCNLVGEMGTGKTLMAMALAHAHADGRQYTALVQVPPQLTKKWAREIISTIAGARVFFVEGIRNHPSKSTPSGVNEVLLDKNKKVRYGGESFQVADLRFMGRRGWAKHFPGPCYFVMGKDRAKLSYAVRPAFNVRSIRDDGFTFKTPVNPDTNLPVVITRDNAEMNWPLEEAEDGDKLLHEYVTVRGQHHASKGTTRFSPLWQADRAKSQRMSPIEYIGRYMKGWFTYGMADEMHELAGETAQGQSFSWVLAASRYGIGFTGTLMGGFADNLYNILYRTRPREMIKDGFEWGERGKTEFQQLYGVLETIVQTKESTKTNTYSRVETKTTRRVKRRPGCSPLVFAKYLLDNTAFVSLEDISRELPPYTEEVVNVSMCEKQAKAYEELAKEMRDALHDAPKECQPELRSKMLHALLLYPNHPFGIDQITYQKRGTYGFETVVAATPEELSREELYATEIRLLEEVRSELAKGRRCQVYVEYTNKHDVRARLAGILQKDGIRAVVLNSSVPTDKREEWYAKQLADGAEVVICHPRLVATGLDLLAFPTIIFYQTSYSLHTLRQASRRSWRIGQRLPVRVLFVCAVNTAQTACVALMGKKMLCALAMEGKFSGEGLESEDTEGDLFTNLAKELLSQDGVHDSANDVWNRVGRERAALMPVVAPAAAVWEAAPVSVVDEAAPVFSFDEVIEVPLPSKVIVMPNPTAKRAGGKKPIKDDFQLSLFAA